MEKPPARAAFFCIRMHRWCDALRCAVPSLRWPYLFCLGRKDMEEKTAGDEIALTRRKNLSLRCACCRYAVRSPNALRAAVLLGFPNARYTVRVDSFAPVEYLTYGIRSVSNIKRLVGADASVRPTLPQSISTTTPVCQRRICIAFCKSKNDFSTNQTTGKIQGRGPQPPSWSFYGGLSRGRIETPP